MNEILVPLDPAEVIDRLAQLTLQAQEVQDPQLEAVIARQRDRLQRTISRILPRDDVYVALCDLLYEVYADLNALEGDMRMHEAQSDFGPAFVALAQSYLATLQRRDAIRADITMQLRDILMGAGLPKPPPETTGI